MSVLLYNRSCYSLLESILTIEKMVSFACEKGYKAIGLCDRSVMYGAMKFHKLCNDRGIKPLIGLQIEFSFNERNYPLIIYPKNDSQFQFLIALSTRLNSGESSVTLEQISDFPDDIILIVPADNELIIRSRKENDQNALHQIISALSGKDVYLATGSSSNAYYNSLNVNIRKAAADFGYKSVAAPLSCYCDKADSYGYRALLAAGKQLLINDERLVSDDTLYLRTLEEMAGVYPADELRRSDEIADKIDVRMDFAVNSLPVYQTGTSADSKTYLKALCNLGLRKRLDSESVPKEYQNRLNYELDVICSMNYQDYFLIVYDIYLFAKKREIYMGVGRGSVCGCLVAYCLGITHVDPLRYGLLFERFLNPERISMPDIDIDIPDDRRSEVIEYIRKKYGEDHTAHIITFNTYGARNALREACRQYSIVSSKTEVLLSSIESGNSVTVKESVRNNPKFQQAIEAIDDRNHNVLRTALALEGLPHNISTHAAGLLISRRKLSETIPLVKLSDSTILSQYTNSYLEAMGLIKFDLLGLKNLSLIDNIVSQIRKTIDFNILSIPLDDKRTFEILSSGKTAGIFQMESFGMNRLIRQVNPQRIEDIIDCIALYRPGPMENIPLYLQARNNPGRINCLHRDLEWILKPTYGIMIYQEQIMQISQVIAGFSYGKADILRRAISKKDSEKMSELENDFITSAIDRGYSRQLAEEIYTQIRRFADYGFNKSHSVAYSLICYQQLYLKANYPCQFYSALFDSIAGNVEKSRVYFSECRSSGIKILRPDINLSMERSYAVSDSIRLSFDFIKSVNLNVVSKILAERNENGLYEDYENFIIRCVKIRIDEKYIIALIKAGVLDSFNLKRKTMISELKDTMKFARSLIYENDGVQLVNWQLLDLYSQRNLNDGNNTDYRSEKLADEIESYGFYLSSHPVESYRKDHQTNFNSTMTNSFRGRARCLGLINHINTTRTKARGEEMSFIKAEDEYGQFDMVMMPDVHARYFSSLAKGDIIYVEGTVDNRNSVKVNTLQKLTGKES